MNIFIDSKRATPIGWIRAHTAEEAIFLLSNCNVSEISLDYVLAKDSKTGYDVLCWINEHMLTNNYTAPKVIHIHTDDMDAKEKMLLLVEDIRAIKEEEVEAEEAAITYKKKRPNFNFSSLNIPVGSELYFLNDHNIKVIVVDDRHVKCAGQVMLTTTAARMLMANESDSAPGPRYWLYEGETLAVRRKRLEQTEVNF